MEGGDSGEGDVIVMLGMEEEMGWGREIMMVGMEGEVADSMAFVL